MSVVETGDGAVVTGRWTKVRVERVADLGLPWDGDRPKLPEGVSPAEAPQAAIERLAGADRFAEAVTLLAFALPKREAVWWACLASRFDLDEETPPAVLACLEAAEAWVYKPVEERRQACYRAVDATRPHSPAALTALAAAWSGGSLVPPEAADTVPAVPPEESLTARTVANAIVLAAVTRDPAGAPDRFRRFLAQGRNIAEGGTGAMEGSAPGAKP
ncbi:hypothetical protein F1188_03065 [Roseospira marina]|uniref:Uncharacterized protein n=1 Tax=Roseospira marina TaxID=140057 RepID=A0A5M6IF51_9PROT|nr:hypothetical protein [Roseospira marina]KAA5606910.1 hypothetical protein F1188_03065 [Roseospira marina]MBB4312919.1 hypothetical protein [Roseospira marina]MBB5086308.1 hypothetical protein [Roseospira marina]